MPESVSWRASLWEQRIAWGVAVCCICLVLLASARPAWFSVTPSIHHSPVHSLQASPSKPSVSKHTAAHHPEVPIASPVKAEAKPHVARQKTPHTVHRPPGRAETTAPIANGYYAQLGAFHEHSRAQGLADQLRHHGWHVVITSTQGGLHAVWAGPKPSHSAAETLLKSVQRTLKVRGFIVHH